jgi:glycosyltransferase involved in cell wall biosynthesis
MKIFIDLTSLARTITGIENHTLNLCKALLKNCPVNITFVLLFRNAIHPDFQEFKYHHKLKVSPFKSQFLTEQVYIPFFLLLHHFDQVFFPCFPPGLLFNGNFITICYDATMWKYQDTLSLKNRLYFKPLAERALKKAKNIFTISESSKIDIESCFPKIKGKIQNISAALPDAFGGQILYSNLQALTKKYNITKKYFISVGSIEPRKNLQFLIETIAPILQEKDMQLVLVGRKAWGCKELALKIKKLNISNFIIQTGYVSTNELQTLYNGAECFLFPSLYEGFGFPILEAFACECPVITSNVSSMPEVAGDAALFIDPRNGKMLCEAIEKILKSNNLKQELVRKGKERLKLFSWDNCAKKCLNVICK